MHPVGDGAADDVARYVLAGLGTERLRWRLIGCAFLAFDRRCTQWQGNLLEQWGHGQCGDQEYGGTWGNERPQSRPESRCTTWN